jgi:hypothetical protein
VKQLKASRHEGNPLLRFTRDSEKDLKVKIVGPRYDTTVLSVLAEI